VSEAFVPVFELILKEIGWIPDGTNPSLEPLFKGMKLAIIGFELLSYN
jgi:hypothetical protein